MCFGTLESALSRFQSRTSRARFLRVLWNRFKTDSKVETVFGTLESALSRFQSQILWNRCKTDAKVESFPFSYFRNRLLADSNVEFHALSFARSSESV